MNRSLPAHTKGEKMCACKLRPSSASQPSARDVPATQTEKHRMALRSEALWSCTFPASRLASVVRAEARLSCRNNRTTLIGIDQRFKIVCCITACTGSCLSRLAAAMRELLRAQVLHGLVILLSRFFEPLDFSLQLNIRRPVATFAPALNKSRAVLKHRRASLSCNTHRIFSPNSRQTVIKNSSP